MDPLRVILFIVGVLIIITIYLWGVRKQLRARWERRRRRQRTRRIDDEPLLTDSDELPDTMDDAPLLDDLHRGPALLSDPEPDLEPEPAPLASRNDTAVRETAALKSRRERTQGPAAAPSMTVLLTVMAGANKTFGGIEIMEAAQALGLKLNRNNGTLDCVVQQDNGLQSLFRIGHLREPGEFRLDDSIHYLSTPGLLLFMQLPGPLEPIVAVDRLIAIAGQLAEKLNGTVCDERRNRMTTQSMVHLRGHAADFDHQWQAWRHRQG